jgi:glyceraldehyde-3-phosphate dehydrogenase/erythrose-4-phosphate dehydrogenase
MKVGINGMGRIGRLALRAAMGSEALRRSEADYTWAANAARMEEVYRRVIAG